MKKIKFSKNSIKNIDIKRVKQIIKSGWLTHGKFTNLFENELKKFTNSKYCITVSSCTAGLHLSCLAAGFKKGHEVIVPAMTHTASAHAVEYTGAKVIFCDVDEKNGNLDFRNIKNKITNKTKGIILVHLNGLSCDLKKILKYCKKKKIKIIEDCAHALGTTYEKKHVGNFGISGSFSFYPTKQITTGEGGAVITNNKNIYKQIKCLKAFGIDKDINQRTKPGNYDVKMLGLNYRMTDFQAALGYGQIKSYKKNLILRHKIAKRYFKNFSKIKKIGQLNYSKENSYFIYPIFTNKRDKMLKYLIKEGIGVSIHYSKPLPTTSYYKKKYNLNIKNYKKSNFYAMNNISLPVYPLLKLKDVDYISQKVVNFIINGK